MLHFAQVVPPDFWTEAVKQVPALAVVMVGGIFVVFAFLRASRRQTDRFLVSLDSRDEEFARLKGDCHAHQTVLANRQDVQSERYHRLVERYEVGCSNSDQLCGEVRDLARKNDELHKELRHEVRDLANAAGLKEAVQQIQFQARGGPPGTVQAVVTPEPQSSPVIRPEPA